MQTLKRILTTALLLLMLTVSAMAGDMGTGYTSTGDMGTGNQATSGTRTPVTTDGDMGTGVTGTNDPATQAALLLLQSVTALF